MVFAKNTVVLLLFPFIIFIVCQKAQHPFYLLYRNHIYLMNAMLWAAVTLGFLGPDGVYGTILAHILAAFLGYAFFIPSEIIVRKALFPDSPQLFSQNPYCPDCRIEFVRRTDQCPVCHGPVLCQTEGPSYHLPSYRMSATFIAFAILLTV